MGYRIDAYYPPLSIEVQNGEITFTDVYGNVYSGRTDESVSFSRNDIDFSYNVHAYVQEGQFTYVINKNLLLCIYLNQPSRNSNHLYNKELYITYKCEIPKALTETRDYLHIGYFIRNNEIFCAILDTLTRNLIYLTDKEGNLAATQPYIILANKFSEKVSLGEAYTYARDLLSKRVKPTLVVFDTNYNMLNLEVERLW